MDDGSSAGLETGECCSSRAQSSGKLYRRRTVTVTVFESLVAICQVFPRK